MLIFKKRKLEKEKQIAENEALKRKVEELDANLTHLWISHVAFEEKFKTLLEMLANQNK